MRAIVPAHARCSVRNVARCTADNSHEIRWGIVGNFGMDREPMTVSEHRIMFLPIVDPGGNPKTAAFTELVFVSDPPVGLRRCSPDVSARREQDGPNSGEHRKLFRVLLDTKCLSTRRELHNIELVFNV